MAVLDYSTGVLRISDTMEVISSPSATSTINLGNTTTNNESSIQYNNNTNLLTLSTNSGTGNIYVDTSGHLGINRSDPKGHIHIYDGDSGRTASLTPQLILENNGNISLLMLSTNTANNTINFGDTDSQFVGAFQYKHSDDSFYFSAGTTTVLTLQSVSSGVNYPNMSGAATGNPPIIEAEGTDTNIPLRLLGKNNGAVQVNALELYNSSGNYRSWAQFSANVNSSTFYTLKHTNNGTIDTFYAYKITLNTTGTTTTTGAVYILDYDGTNWNVHLVSSAGTGSNHPYVFLDSGVPKVRTDHGTLYTVYITMEAIYQGASEATPHIWGSDYTLEYDATSTNVRSGGLWVGKGSYGSAPTPSTSADDLVLENATSAGISILSATDGGIRWGDAANNTAAFLEYNHTSDYMRFGGKGSGAEMARFNSTGHFIVGKTSTASSTAGTVLYSDGAVDFVRTGAAVLYINRLTSDGTLVNFQQDGTTEGSISISGTITSYNTTSDYRLKENVVDLTNGLDVLQAFSPRQFNFIANPATTVAGYIAHEVQDQVPIAVQGEKDGEEMQQMEASKLIPYLHAAILELKAEIETLKEKK